MSKLELSIENLEGVGASRQKLFSRLGIHTLSNLIMYFPVSHENRGNTVKVDDADSGEYASLILEVITPVTSNRIKSAQTRRAMSVQKFVAGDETGGVKMTFFNCDYLKDVFTVGRKFRFYGIINGIAGNCTMTSPVYEPYSEKVPLLPYVPKYPLTAGLTSKLISSCVKQALEMCGDEICDYLTDDQRTGFGLCSQLDALLNIHFPQNEKKLEEAKLRLAFDELYHFQLKTLLLSEKSKTANAYRINYPDMKAFVSGLEFELTKAQKRVIQDILIDITGVKKPEENDSFKDTLISPARRLIQGDVGSGKTVVAAAIIYACALSGLQSALMVPTSVLAFQHYESVGRMLSKFNIRTALLTGDTKAAEKKQILADLKNGKIDLLIGTHALIEEKVEFSRLALVITDEQHRFGVEQRKVLEGKSKQGILPHTLVMSATPIPRTLAMIMYCDLDISVIDEMPKGRQIIDTFAVGTDKRQRVYNFIRQKVSEGRQAYIVCPLAMETNKDGEYIVTSNYEMKSAKELCQNLEKGALSGLRLDFLHGRMKPSEKDKVMGRFAKGEIDVLVSTTVIEVGVNVPNAALMVIENAERFGLSQLHQLRGRVGRGEHKSFCVVISEKLGKNKDSNFEKRIGIFCATNDGFEIARKDLEIRGPGEFFGRAQHGEICFKMADVMRDVKLLEVTKKLALEHIEKQKGREAQVIGI